jgi:Uncharacterized conserved protein (DUF2285)/Family of unknown function (DUF6499)
MRRVSDWRSFKTASEFETHDRADLAQEFLCRNSAYECELSDAQTQIAANPEEHTNLLGNLAHQWGLSVPCSPDLSPMSHPAHWSSDFAPSVVILGVASFDSGPVIASLRHKADSILADDLTSDGRHLVIVDGKRKHRLRLVHIADIQVAAYATTVLDTDRIRLGATLEFNRWLHGSGPQLLHQPLLPTGYQRQRLVKLLRISDAKADGASLHDIAYIIVFPQHWPLAGAAWRGSCERRTCLRLAAEARRLIQGDYRKLLAA